MYLLFVSDEHSTKVKSFMLDILCPLICESDMVASELLDIILINIVEPNKTQRKNAYSLAKELILKCSNTLEPYIQSVSVQFTVMSTGGFSARKNIVIVKHRVM